jgi:glycerophosphoryl diester phosphodiesterase
MSRPRSVAHRGFSARYAENTITAQLAAIAAGADLVETDARLSADGDVFCIHDPDLSRIASLAVPVGEMTSADLQAIPLAGGEHLMTLHGFLAAVGAGAGILIDVKTADEAVLERVLGDLAAHGNAREVWLGLRALDQLKALRRRADVNCVALLEDYGEAEAWIDAGADALRVWEGEFTPEIERRLAPLAPLWITAGGRKTPERPGDIPLERLRALLRRPVAAVLLNDPTLLTTALGEVAQ